MRAKQQKTISLLATALTLASAFWLGFNSYAAIIDPSRSTVFKEFSFKSPHVLTAQLDMVQRYLLPIDKALPPDAALRFISHETGEHLLDYIQAVLAPRRIGRDIDSPYLFVYPEPKKWVERHPELRNARLLQRIYSIGDIYLKKETP